MCQEPSGHQRFSPALPNRIVDPHSGTLPMDQDSYFSSAQGHQSLPEQCCWIASSSPVSGGTQVVAFLPALPVLPSAPAPNWTPWMDPEPESPLCLSWDYWCPCYQHPALLALLALLGCWKMLLCQQSHCQCQDHIQFCWSHFQSEVSTQARESNFLSLQHSLVHL